MAAAARGGVSRVAVVGGGVAGLGAAAALAQAARVRGRGLDITVFDGGRAAQPGRPVLLTPECRSRLAAVGCRVPPEWQAGALRGVEILSDNRREFLSAPAAGLWVVDGEATGVGGQALLREQLRATVESSGAVVVQRRVEGVERMALVPGTPAGRGRGDLLVRAAGQAERFDAALLAAGVAAPVGPHFLQGYRGPRTLPAVEARLRLASSESRSVGVARLWVAPLPALDGLLLVPCEGSVYALGFGPGATPADLCQALMMAARDGLIDEGFELAHVAPTCLPAGAGRRLVAEGRLAVGPAALGHPLQLGVAATLATASRAASALMEIGTSARSLKRRYVTDGLVHLLDDAEAGTAAVSWLRKAGPRAAGAFARAASALPRREPWSGGVLGLGALTPRALHRTARRYAILESLSRLVRAPLEPIPVGAHMLEPDLYYVVDDDVGAREALRQLLESHRAQVVCFADELALYSAVARRPPTAILLDVVLQWVDGLRLCEGLKAHPLTRATRVVVMSGLDRPHVRRRALEAGAEVFLPKPLRMQDLLRVLTHGQTTRLGGPKGGDAAGGSERYASI